MMVAEGTDSHPITRVKDGREWRIGGAAEIAWIAEATAPGLEITSAVPAAFAAYCTLALPESLEGMQRRHDQAMIALLEGRSEPQPWWLGYLETGLGDEVVFYDAPRVKLYSGWDYVWVQAGPEQALGWRQSEGRHAPWKGALPDLMFPNDHSWLLSTLWDDHWSCIGGSEAPRLGLARGSPAWGGSLMVVGVVAASVALGRAPAEVDWPGEPTQLSLALALRDALLGLLIEIRRLYGRHATLGGAAHGHCPAHGADGDLELVTGADLAARLGGHAIDMDAPALDGVRRQRACLE